MQLYNTSLTGHSFGDLPYYYIYSEIRAKIKESVITVYMKVAKGFILILSGTSNDNDVCISFA